jgi:GNAT superfamily N-acetyltransferase
MNKDDVVAAIENNLLEAWKSLSGLPGVEYHASPDMIRYIGGISFPLCNSIMKANFPAGDPAGRIKEALTPIQSRGLPMLWWTGPATKPADLGAHLERQGLTPAESVPCMGIDLRSIKENRLEASGLVIREVQNREDLHAWLEIFGVVFEVPDVAVDFFRRAMSYAGLRPDLPYRHYLGLWEDKPVACSSVYLGTDSAGIYNVATIPAFRSRGIGSIMTKWPMLVAKERGYGIAILHSSAMGLPVYEKLGFREYCRLTIYLWQPQ